MRTKGWLTYIVFLMMASSGFAGDWSSGSGDLNRDDRNPWFLENTKEVRYCIKKDPASFHQSHAELNELIKQAITYWQYQFKKAIPGVVRANVATQTFIFESCTKTTDIRFQFGVLTDRQYRHLQNPRRLVGIAVRTNYDRAKLKARGFVYISPDRGPIAYKGANLVRNAWSYGEGGLLFKVIVHEMGHVFGIPHVGRSHQIMAADFPAFILSKDNADRFSEMEIRGGPFKAKIKDVKCFQTGNAAAIKFFGLKAGYNCVIFSQKETRDFWVIAHATDRERVLLGSIDVQGVETTRHVVGVKVALTPKQSVFNNIREHLLYYGYLRGPTLKERYYSGKFKSEFGLPDRQILIQLSPLERLRVSGMLDGQWHPNLIKSRIPR